LKSNIVTFHTVSNFAKKGGILINDVKENPELAKSKFRASNEWMEGGHNRTTVNDFYSAGQEISHTKRFVLEADEPPILAGQDQAANPVEHLLNALAT
jgi:hypothetical protein